MIVVKLKYGMGNQMFQYAAGRAMSIERNDSLGLDIGFLLNNNDNKSNHITRTYDLGIYNINAVIVDKSKTSFIYRYYKEIRSIFFVRLIRFILKKIFKLKINFGSYISNTKSVSYIEGHWQSEKYFINIADTLIEDFKPKIKLSLDIENLMEIIKKENSLCIHVRRGDYIGDKDFEVITRDYYDKALEYINKKTKIDKIYLFSDDIKWCEENMKFETPTMYVGDEYAGEKAVGHHMLMRSCKNFIIPNSTFSWWAAWLAPYKDKIIIAPKRWFPETSKHKDIDNIVPESWIKI